MLVVCQISVKILLKFRLKLVSCYSNLYLPHSLSVNEPKAVAGLIKSPKELCQGGYGLWIKKGGQERGCFAPALPRQSWLGNCSPRQHLLIFQRHATVSAGHGG